MKIPIFLYKFEVPNLFWLTLKFSLVTTTSTRYVFSIHLFEFKITYLSVAVTGETASKDALFVYCGHFPVKFNDYMRIV